MDINLELLEKQLNNKSKHTNKDDNPYRSVICLYDFFCLNNIKICEKIKENYNLSNRYHIINSCQPISIGEVSDKIYHYNANNTDNNNK